jgi:hypothetical protein
MSLRRISKLFHVNNEDIGHAPNQMLQMLVLLLAFIAGHLDHFSLAMEVDA